MPDPPGAATQVRILDPAYRDQDAGPWVKGRFAERVRREWNPVRTPLIAQGATLTELADALHEELGVDREHILERLRTFARADGVADGSQLPGQPLAKRAPTENPAD